MKVLVFGYQGKVGAVVAAGLERAGHEVLGVEVGDAVPGEPRPQSTSRSRMPSSGTSSSCLRLGVPVAVGTSGWEAEHERIDGLARERGTAVFFAPNFSIGAVLMMRFAVEAAKHLPKAEIVELHHDTKLDAPSGTAKATAAAMGGDPQIHSVRLPGLLAHQEVLLGGPGQLLTIRHDTLARDAFVPGVLLALEKLPTLSPGLTTGLDALLD